MRVIVLSLAVMAAVGLAGCNGNGNGAGAPASGGSAMASGGSSASAPVPTSVSGTVGLRDAAAHQLSDQAKLTIKLADLTDASSAPLDTKVVSPITSLPVHFDFTLKSGQYHASNVYVVQAEIVDGTRHYTMPLQAPVLTKGAPSTANIRLVAQQTPGEKLLDAYKDMKAQAGAMKMSKDTSLNKSVSRGWQVFRDKATGDVRYIVELSDFVKGGFTHTEFGYQKGKPWVVIREHKPSQHAKPSEIDRVGWNEDGKLVLNEQVSNGKTTTLDTDTVDKLRKDAVAMFAKAQKTH